MGFGDRIIELGGRVLGFLAFELLLGCGLACVEGC